MNYRIYKKTAASSRRDGPKLKITMMLMATIVFLYVRTRTLYI